MVWLEVEVEVEVVVVVEVEVVVVVEVDVVVEVWMPNTTASQFWHMPFSCNHHLGVRIASMS